MPPRWPAFAPKIGTKNWFGTGGGVRLPPGKLWLCAAPAILCVLDNALTLYGQPPEYWQGDYQRANEGNPVERWFFHLHPGVFVAGTFLWVLLFVALIVALPWRAAKVLSLGVALGHVVGANAWLWQEFALYWLFPPVLLASAWMIVWTWERAECRRHDGNPVEPRLTRHSS
jgi:hypothetical protein